jgi:hypothetical protein
MPRDWRLLLIPRAAARQSERDQYSYAGKVEGSIVTTQHVGQVMPAWELTAREQVRNIIAEYAFAVDRPSLSWIAGLFHADGVLQIDDADCGVSPEGIKRMLRERAKAGASLPAKPYSKHLVGSICFLDVQPDEITVKSYFVRMDRDRAIHWGTYHDVLVPRDGRWLIKSRRVALEAAAPGDPLRRTR